MDRLERNGQVAILVSPGFGAGWSTWNTTEDYRDDLIFDPEIAQAVLDGDTDKASKIAEHKYPDVCTLGADDLEVRWLDKGTVFRITEYDGSESVSFPHHYKWLTA